MEVTQQQTGHDPAPVFGGRWQAGFWIAAKAD